MKVTDKYVFFFSWQDVLSNHHRLKTPIRDSHHVLPNEEFWTVEHFMMYEKAKFFGDEEIAQKILGAYSPRDAKSLGRKVKGFDNGEWDRVRGDVVYFGLLARVKTDLALWKFVRDHRLAGRSFVEASPYDKIWGIGIPEDHPHVEDKSYWRGQNLLGTQWDRVADEIIAKEIRANASGAWG